MPLILNLKCSPRMNFSRDEKGLHKNYSSSCDFKINNYYGRYMCLKMDDGSEAVLPHPLEDTIAMDLTGKKVDQLFKENRIFFKDEMICLNCFRRKDGNEKCECEKPKFVEISELEGKACPKCGEGIIGSERVGIT